MTEPANQRNLHIPEPVNDDGMLSAARDEDCRAELRGWAGLAIMALALAGSPALLLAASRIPGVEDLAFWPLDYFQRALVVHVVLSIVVWTLACFGAMTLIAGLSLPSRASLLGGLGRPAIWMGWLALPLLVIPGFSNLGEASLNNYVPVILHPVYGLGLALIFGAVLLSVVRLLVNLRAAGDKADPSATALAITGIVYTTALGCLGVAALTLGDGPYGTSHMEHLFWGGGHILQFVNLGLLLIGLHLLYVGWTGRVMMSGGRLIIVFLIILLPAILAPTLYITNNSDFYFSKLKYLAAIPAFVFLAFGWHALTSNWQSKNWRDPAFLAFFLAMVVFALGGSLGFFVDGTDTRTPSHYHGVLGAVNIALMGLFHSLIMPMLGRPTAQLRRVPWQLWLYAGGQALQCLGLFLAGGYGTPRKTAGADQGLEHIGAIIGMYLNGIGALIAVIGGIIFIWTIGTKLIKKPLT